MSINSCNYCGISLEAMSSRQKASHVRWCDKGKYAIPHSEIQRLHDEQYNDKQISTFLNISYSAVKRSFETGKSIKRAIIKFKHTDETKKRLSFIRHLFLKENPDKHNWKHNDKFISAPCEEFKLKLKENGISFVPEYSPLEDRNFSIDIAFPIKKIGLEINGNQHYDKQGHLLPYYQKRKELIEAEGWTLYDFHYTFVYNNDKFNSFIYNLKNDFDLTTTTYEFFIKEKPKTLCIECSKEITKTSKRCKRCSQLFRQRNTIERPTPSQLKIEVENTSYRAVGRKYNVSDNTIRKWLKISNK